MLLYVFMESGFWQVQSQYLLEKYVKICPTPFAADSGFAACGDAPRASKGFGR